MVLSGPDLATLVLGTFVVMATPGVTVSAITGATLRHGRIAGFQLEAGAMLARLTMLVVLAFGLEAVGRTVAAAFDVIKLVGAAYLVWLGLRMIAQPFRLGGDAAPAAAPGRLAGIGSGFVVLWTNPKAFLFAGAFLPQFIDPAAAIAPQIAVVGAIWLGVVALTDSAYILLADAARRLLSGRFARRTGLVAGLVLIVGGVWLALQGKA